MSLPATIILLVLLIIAIVLTGYALQKWRTGRFAAWLLALVGVIIAFLITIGQAPIIIMTALILSLLFGMKAVVAISDQKGIFDLPHWLAFTTLWLGMRPSVFLRFGDRQPGAIRLIRKGTIRLVFGLGLFVLAHLVWHNRPMWLPGAVWLILVLALVFPALSLMLHFGFLNILTGMWRWLGAPATSLFNAPFKATTLADFWGRRWNVAFAEMTAIAVYRPLRLQHGNGVARAVAFLFSGLAHELAISVPVQSGYGLPTLYFALQALGMHFEKRHQLQGRLWTALWVLIPAPILFHTDFLFEIVLPLLNFRIKF